MNPEQLPTQLFRSDGAKSEQELKELEVEKITRALEQEVFLGVSIEEYGDPYVNVKSLIKALNGAGRSQDVVKIFEEYAPLSSEDVFGTSADMFGDTEQLYRFTVDELLKNGHITEAEAVFQHIKERGLPARNRVSDSLGEKHTEKDDIHYLNNLQLDLLLAKMRYRQSPSPEMLHEESDLASDLTASISETNPTAKASAYLKLVEAKFAAGYNPKDELQEAERLVHAIPGKDIDKFQRVANLVKTSVATDNSESERHLQMLLQCGYQALHGNDKVGEMFRGMAETMSVMRGKKVDPHMQIMSPQLAASVSDPLSEVIREVAKNGKTDLAFQLAELELYEDWTRWEAYTAAIEGLPMETVLPSTIEPRLRELCREVSIPLQMEKFRQLVTSLTNRGQSVFALELIDLTDLEPKHKRELYGDVAEGVRKNGNDLESVLQRLSEPHTIDELVQLGRLDEAQKVFEGLSIRDRIHSGTVLISALIQSGRDIKKVANQVYQALQDDKPENEYDSAYAWLHERAPQDLFIALLQLKGVEKKI